MTRQELIDRLEGLGNHSKLVMSWIDELTKEEAISFCMKTLGIPASARDSVGRQYNKFLEGKGKNKSE